MKSGGWILLVCLLVLSTGLSAQDIFRKSLPATRTETPPRIDGVLDDPAWAVAPTATDFVMFEPENGDAIPKNKQTYVKVLYDNSGLYFGAFMYDAAPDSILTQMTERDNFFRENTDWFGLFINPYNDGLSDFNFWVTAAGTQADARTTVNGDDFSINSVWKSKVNIIDSGWVVEVFIPYIALRFPETPVTDWGLNFIRNVRRTRKMSTWNFLDKSSGYRLEYQCGLLTNMADIDPPVRLSAVPYFSAYLDDYRGNTTTNLNAGLDLKYGLNEAFTLDMTVIPDFGQVAFDQQFLNLSPFENEFDENRQFFNEGTELFNIGDLLYTRRIGGQPKNIQGVDLAANNENVTIRQEFTRMLNATKISGRTSKNLGIGVMNAITDDNFSTRVEDGVETQLLTEPMTNYNVFVLDQRINRNSSLSFVNTNTMRRGAPRDANVAAVVGDFISSKGKMNFGFNVNQSALFENGQVTDGYRGGWTLGDIEGNWRWRLDQELITDDFDINDLGFQRRNNQIGHYGSIQYLTIQPVGPWVQFEHELSVGYQSLYKPFRYEDFFISYRTFYMTRGFFAFGANGSVKPANTFDYFEPRTPGRWFKVPPRVEGSAFISSDYRKVLAIDSRINYSYTAELQREGWQFRLAPRLRLGDRFFGVFESIAGFQNNDYGFVPVRIDNDVFFGRRNNINVENSINASYVFTPTASLSLALRHSYTDVDYQDFYLLETNGDLQARDNIESPDLNFNTFNVDLRFSWWFAPASEFVFLYRNVIATAGNVVGADYLFNLEQTLNSPMQNNVSIRLNYFLDYHTTKQHFKQRRALSEI